VFQARCGFAHNSVLGAALSKTPIAADSTLNKKLRSETISEQYFRAQCGRVWLAEIAQKRETTRSPTTQLHILRSRKRRIF